jgi:hypothetical protein
MRPVSPYPHPPAANHPEGVTLAGERIPHEIIEAALAETATG